MILQCQTVLLLQVYYYDNTAEWLSFDQETAFIGEEIVFTRSGSAGALWPSQRYSMTEKLSASDLLTDLQGYKKGGVYVEYFSNLDDKEYAFTKYT